MSNRSLYGILHRLPVPHTPIRKYAAIAPRVRQARQIENRSISRGERTERPTWPTALLDAAHRAGGLSISSSQAVTILDRTWDLKQRQVWSKGAMLKVLEENETSSASLTLLAKILMRSDSEQTQVNYASELLFLSSEMGDQAATMILVDEGLCRSNLGHHQLQKPLRHLDQLVNDNVVEAVVLAARVNEVRGNSSKALSLFRRATTISSGPKSAADLPKASLSEAWMGIARIERDLGHASSASEAVRTAALEYDSSEAFYELALESEVEKPEEMVNHLLKAAISGVGNAAYKLGLWYSAQADDREHSITNLSDVPQKSFPEAQRGVKIPRKYKVGHEWFSVAAESESCEWRAQAALHTARILLKSGLVAESEYCLESIFAHKEIKPKLVTWLRENWTGSSFEPSTVEFEELIQGRRRWGLVAEQ